MQQLFQLHRSVISPLCQLCFVVPSVRLSLFGVTSRQAYLAQLKATYALNKRSDIPPLKRPNLNLKMPRGPRLGILPGGWLRFRLMSPSLISPTNTGPLKNSICQTPCTSSYLPKSSELQLKWAYFICLRSIVLPTKPKS